MEHHRAFNVYSKHKRSERIVDTLLFKHKYPTSPIVTQEDTDIESTKRLTYEFTANSNSTESVKIESLEKLAKVFKKLAEKNAQKVADKQPKNNSIKTYNKESQPRVAFPQPRVERTTPEQ